MFALLPVKKIVQAHDLVTAIQQLLHQMGADESAAAGDQDTFHVAFSFLGAIAPLLSKYRFKASSQVGMGPPRKRASRRPSNTE